MFEDSVIRQARRIFQAEMRKHPLLREKPDVLKLLEIVAYHRGIKPEPSIPQETSIQDNLPEQTPEGEKVNAELSQVSKQLEKRQAITKGVNLLSGFSRETIRKMLETINIR